LRILFTIPHFYDPNGGGFYGSLRPDPKPRAQGLVTEVFGLHTTFGARQGLLDAPKGRILRGTGAEVCDIDVVICTTGAQHLLGKLPMLKGLYRHQATQAEPKMLGFECHAVLREGLGQYDYYCYLEDDLLITDPLFFRKLAWFASLAGDRALLQPNRFESALDQPWHKLYIDGNLAKPEMSARYQNIADRKVIHGEGFGARWTFQRVINPHAGCFFLDARQMEAWASRPDFLDRDSSFISPLESAATLGIMRAFRIYKPAKESAGFLEVRHVNNRYLGGRLRLSFDQPERLG
jgi:hypothetical protein